MVARGRNMHQPLRYPLLRAGIATGAILVGAAISAGSAAAAGPTTWTAMAGTGDATGVAANKFYPAAITIDAGDTVTWKAAGNAHVVAFIPAGQTPPAPDSPAVAAPAGGSSFDGTALTSSGFMVPLPPGGTPPPGTVGSYSLTFPTAGTYQFHCLIHPSMVGTLTVQGAGATYPQTQAQLDATAAAAEATDIATGHALEAAYKPSVTTNADGTKTYDFAAGIGKDDIEILRFVTAHSSIRVGDSIVWTNYSSGEPHSVSFGTEPQGPAAEAPAGGSSYSGTGFVSSGLYFGAPLPGPHSYKLTFTKAGTYKYFCVLHDIIGMVGSVNVVAAPVATLPPTSTVSPAASSSDGGSGLPWALLALGAAVALVSIGRLARRSSR